MAYATSQDYLSWTDTSTAPTGLGRILEVASTRIDELLVGCVYPVNAAGQPTDTDIADVLSRATCEQALYMIELGDTTGARSGMKSMTIGRIQWERTEPKTGIPKDERFAPGAISILHTEGMVPVSVLRLP